MDGNVIYANFEDGRRVTSSTGRLYQWDKNQKLKVIGIDNEFESVTFGFNKEQLSETAPVAEFSGNLISIPDEVLENSGNLICYIEAKETGTLGTISRTTLYKVMCPVHVKMEVKS